MENNFTPLQSDALFTPASAEDYIRPYAAAEQLFQKRKGELEQRADILANYLPYINDSTPEAKKLYDDAQNKLDMNLQLLGSKGWNLNMEPILAFKQQYRQTNTLLGKAVTELEKQRAQDEQQRAQKGENICISYELQDGEGNGTGRFTVPNLDNMLRQDVKRYTVDCDDVQQKAMQVTGGAMGRANAAWSRMGETFYATDPDTGLPLKGPDGKYIKANMPFTTYGTSHSTSNEGTIGGIRSSMMLEYIMNPEKFQKEIAAYKKDLVRYCGDEQAAKQVVDAFFNGELRDQLNGVLDQVGYDHQDVPSQKKINLALMRGLYAASGWKENKHVSSHWNNTGGGGGRGGGYKESGPTGFDMTTNLYQPEDKAQSERRSKALDWFNIDSSKLDSNGEVSYIDKLGLKNRGRAYDGKYKNGVSSYQKLDNIMRRNNSGESGMKDAVSLFDEKGRLKSKEEFRDLFKEICSEEYYQKMSGDANVGNVYKNDISDRPTGATLEEWVFNDQAKTASNLVPATANIGADLGFVVTDAVTSTNRSIEQYTEDKLNNFYTNLEKAMMDMYDVPEQKKNEILKDKTGNKWNEFVASNKITKENFIDRADDVVNEEANTTTDMLTMNYSKDTDYIAQRALANVQRNEDGDYLLHEIPSDDIPYTFTNIKDTDADGNSYSYKDFKIKASIDPVEVSHDELFGGNGDKSNFEYYIAPNPSQGLVIKNKNTNKQYLVSPAELRNTTFPAGALEQVDASIKAANKMIYRLKNQMRMCYKQIRRLNEHQGTGDDVQRYQKQIYSLQGEIDKQVQVKQQAYQYMSTILNQGLSYSTKPATNGN